MNHSYLTLTLHFSSAICLVMGVLLWVESHDNRARRLLGISMTVFGFSFLIRIFTQEIMEAFEGILPTRNLAGGCLLAFLLSLYPLEVVRPGWLTQRKFILLFSPWLLLLGGVIIYAAGGIGETVIPSATAIPELLGHADVWFRLAFLVLIFGYILVIYLIPLLWRKANPEACQWLYGFIGGMLVIHMAYLLLMFTMEARWDAIHKAVVFFFVFYMGYKALFHENPSRRSVSSIGWPAETLSAEPKPEEPATESELWIRILACMNNGSPWMDADFLLPSLSSFVNSNRTSVSAEIRRHGFSSFNEFVSRYRIDEFKRQMNALPGIPRRETITDAWQSSGYRSYNTFYRNFCDIEGVPPSEYLKKQIVIDSDRQ